MSTIVRTVADRIRHLAPCPEAMEWASGYASPAKAWAECRRGDWMLWLLGTQAGSSESDGRKKLVLCACECARLALPYTSDPRVLACIETSERWARGEATIEQLREARSAAYAVAYNTVDTAEARAANAADAAAGARSVAAVYAAAADARAAAAGDAWDADADDAWIETQGRCADIVRRHYPKPPKIRSKR